MTAPGRIPANPAGPAGPDEAAVLAGTPVFAGLDAADWPALRAHGGFLDLDAGAVILREGAPSPYLQVICRGEVEIRKRDPGGRQDHLVAVLGPGETFGELGLARDGDPQPAIASVVARRPVRLFRIPIATVKSAPELAGARRRMVENVARILVDRIDRTNDVAVGALRDALTRQKLLGQYLINLIVVFSLFSLSLLALDEAVSLAGRLGLSRSDFGTLHSLLFTFLLSGGVLFSLRRAGMDLRALGVDLDPRGWRAALGHAFRWSVPPILAMAPVRAALYPDEPVLHPYVWLRAQPDSLAYELALFAFYVGIVAWLQEIVARVGLQAVIFDMLAEKRRAATVLSIVVSAIGFGAFHAFYGLGAVLATTLIGLYWGVMFHRRRSLFAVGVSHMLIGAAGCYLFGLLRW